MLMQWLSLTNIERAVLIALYQSHNTGLYASTIAHEVNKLLDIIIDDYIIGDVMENSLMPLGLAKLPYSDNRFSASAFYMLTEYGYSLTHTMIMYHNVLENLR